MLNLIPMPKSVFETGSFAEYKSIDVSSCRLGGRLEKAISKLPCSENGADLIVDIKGNDGEGYTLEVGECTITLTADSEAGGFWGIQTLRQLFEYDKIPCCTITDEPDFAYRGFYHDVTRGKVPTLDTLKKLVDDMAYYKLNSLQLYVEHTYEFKEFADSIERTGYLTAEEIRELDSYCSENFVELIPSLSTFGHLYELLQKEQYKHLRELDDYDESKDFMWRGRMMHHTIDPTNPESLELIKSLLDQFIPLFSSDKFNICCDETFDLENGRHKGMDTGKLYTGFVSKIVEYVRSKGKTVMMWADILLKHPEQVEKLPENVVFLNWNYSAEPPEKNAEVFAKLNRTQIMCPGTTTWNRICENVEVETKNISKMAEYGKKYGAEGILNTNWGDWGNLCSIELAMYGMLLGAEKSWNTEAEDFDKRADSLLYKSDYGTECLKELSDIHSKIIWIYFVQHYQNMELGTCFDAQLLSEADVKEVLSRISELVPKLEKSGIEPGILEEMLIAAEGIAVMAELFAKAADYDIKRYTDTGKWLGKYSRKWLEKNKPSELCEIEKVFRGMER